METAILLSLAAMLGLSAGLFDFFEDEPEPPEADDDTASTTEDTAVTIDVLANDEDPDGDALSVTSASALNGSVTVEANDRLTYTPNPDFSGTDWIRYGVVDGDGDTDDAVVTVDVAAANDLPVATDDAASTVEDTLVTINVLGNDSDVDGDPLTVTSASATNGSVAIGAGGSLTYTPNADFSGTDMITYEVSDGAGGIANASVAVSVGAVNDAPVAGDDTVSTAEDTPVTVDVLGNDTDVDGDTLAVTTASATNGTVVVEADGSLTYTPNADFSGTDTISYEVSDGAGGTATGSVAVSVGAVNDAPVAVDDTVSTTEDTPVTVDVLGNDTDVDGDILTVTSASATNGTVVVEADGSLTYTPNADFSGTDTISYEVSDGAGGTASANVAVSVTAEVLPSNDTYPIDGGTEVSAGDGAIVGGPESELFPGSEGNDDISGGVGADTIFGQAGSDTLNGDAGDDEINGIWDGSDDGQIEARDLADPDILLGGDGDDDIFMGSGDTATGEGGRDTFYTGTWVDPDNAPVVLDLASDEILIVSVPEGTSAGTSITLETDPLTGDTLVQANLQTVAVIAAGVGPVTADQILVVENANIA